mmetsp:Transcript_26588/g.23565  ORF Transcript_26588/g.23565 Transcript_26588/m.23565 type:complete len:98 (+) Transcript_26588:989-1282(+)
MVPASNRLIVKAAIHYSQPHISNFQHLFDSWEQCYYSGNPILKNHPAHRCVDQGRALFDHPVADNSEHQASLKSSNVHFLVSVVGHIVAIAILHIHV